VNVVLISPHFPTNFYHFAVALRRAGADAFGIADAPYDDLRPELRAAFTEYFRVEEMQRYDSLLRAVAYLTYRHGKIDRLESHNEFWLETDARLRSDFNIPGIRSEAIADIKAKSRMKARFVSADVPVAHGEIVRTAEDARRVIERTGYPVVAKPDVGVGAAHTYRIDDEAGLTRFLANKPPIDYFMEEFIHGTLYSFDGLVDRNGEPVFCACHVFAQGIMETVNEDHDLHYYSLRAIPADLEDAGRRTLAAFSVRERFFHIEFFRTHAEGRLVALEVNMRPPGGLTMDIFNYANDADLYTEWANLVTGRPLRSAYDRPYFCGYAGRKAHKTYRRTHNEVLHDLGGMIVHHQPMSPIFGPVMGHYAYLLRSPDEADVREAIRRILELA
jgi:hypothetical protein